MSNYFFNILEDEEETSTQKLAKDTLEKANVDVANRVRKQNNYFSLPTPTSESLPTTRKSENYFGLPDKQVDLEQIDTGRKIAYGAAQEPMILGSLGRVVRAGVESVFSEETFDEVLKDIEKERQEKILDKFPEFKGLKEEDAAILSGRVSTALVDPITFLIPWTKIGKAGRLATVGTGAGVATADVALREKVLYGEVNPGSLLLAGTLGGVSSGIGDVVAKRFRAPDEPDIKLTKKDQDVYDEIEPLSIASLDEVLDSVRDAPNTSKIVAKAEYSQRRFEEANALYKQLNGKAYKAEEARLSKYQKQLEAIKAKPATVLSTKEGIQFHGTSKQLPKKLEDVELGYTGSEQNIYGSGFYTTSKHNIAKGYAKENGFIYEVSEKKGIKLFNMDNKVPDNIKKEIFSSPDWDEFGQALVGFLATSPKTSLLKLHDEARAIGNELRYPAYELQDVFYGWSVKLMEQGYDGYKHIGGILSKGEKHNVKIYWNPSRALTIKPLSKKGDIAKQKRILKQEEKINKQILKLTTPKDELASIYRKAGVKDFDELKALNKEAQKTISQSYDVLNKNSEIIADAILEPIDQAAKKGELTESLIQKIMYESTRPLFGAGVGWALGTTFGDEDDSSLMWSLTGIGLVLGHVQKKVQRADFKLTKSSEKAINDVIQKTAKRSLFTFLKINTATSTAARTSAWGDILDTFSKLMFKQQGATLKGKAVMSVEEREMSAFQQLSKFIHEEVLGHVDHEIAVLAGKLQNGFTTRQKILEEFGSAKTAQVVSVKNNIDSFQNLIGDYVTDVGIKWDKLDNYGLTQMWDWKAIHANPDLFRVQLHKAIAKQHKLDPIADLQKIETLSQKFSKSIAGVSSTSVFTKDGKTVTIPLTKNFEKKRMLTDQDARIEMQDFLVNDPRLTLQTLVGNTVPSVEFARTFGSRGELLKSIRQEIHNKYNNLPGDTTKLKAKEIKQLHDAIDGYFGLYQANQRWSDQGQTTMAGLTALANSTMLTRVVIPSLGDLIQPLQNSGARATIQGYGKAFRKGEQTFAEQGLGIKYASQLENELRALAFGVDPSNATQAGINAWNRKFFKIVQLERLTNYARARAYDIGVYRAFNISKKTGKINQSLRTEMNALGMSDDSIKVLRKFNTAEEAYTDPKARAILHNAGFKSAERDAIIPTAGNRLLFSQSNNPAIRAIGQFISWAQAKTTQTNALMSRVESGDAKQAIRILGALTIYGGVRDLQIAFSPSKYYEDEKNVPPRFSKEWIADATVLSGNVPVFVDKVFNSYAGPGSSSPVTSIVPVLSLMEDLLKTPPKVINNASNDDYWGVTSNIADVTPFGRDLKNLLRKLGFTIEDKPNIKELSAFDRALRATGGLIEGEGEIPNTKEKPEERINPFTGEPYTALYKRDRVPFDRGGEGRIIKEGSILELIRKHRGDAVANSLVSFGDKVGEIESNNIPTRVQDIKLDGQLVADGPGRGKYQFEMFYRGGKGGAKTAVQRALNLYEQYGQKAPENLIKLSLQKDIDFSKLPESLQDDIFYANAAMKKGFRLDDLASGKLTEKEAWLTHHWAGKEEDRKEKSTLWDDRFVSGTKHLTN
jgi:hypothetical protein